MDADIPQIAPTDAQAALTAGATLLDCREAEELAICRVADALHIPMNDIPSRLQELDPDAEWIVMCHSGRRSHAVCVFLREQGFERVQNLRGGIDAWAVDVDQSLARY